MSELSEQGHATSAAPAGDGLAGDGPASDGLASPPEDLAARVRLLEAVETELRERLGRLEQR